MKVRYKSCSICLIADLDSAVVAFVYVEIDFFANSFANKILESKSPMFWGVLKKFGFLRKIQNPHDYWGYFVL